MDVRQVLADAWEAVESAGVPESLHPVAFEQAVRLLTDSVQPTPAPKQRKPDASAKTTETKTKNPQGSAAASKGTASEPSHQPVTDEDAFFEKFAEESGIGAETLRIIYYINNGNVRLNLSRRVLGATLAEKNRSVAMLTLGLRHYVNGDMALKITDVREAIQPHGYDPTRNLSKHLDDIPGTQAVGAKAERAVRVQTGRFDAPFREMIERLTTK